MDRNSRFMISRFSIQCYFLRHIMAIIKLNIREAKNRLSHYLEKVERGSTILLCRRNHPIAEIRPLATRRNKPRPIGLAKGKFTVPASFFEDLPEESLALFRGKES